MPDAGRGGETHCAMADLAGEVARDHGAERGLAGAFRSQRLWLAAVAGNPVARGSAGDPAQGSAGRARFGEAKKSRPGNRSGDGAAVAGTPGGQSRVEG